MTKKIDTSKHIENILALSTAHMPETSPDFYDLRTFDFEYGYIVWTASLDDLKDNDHNGIWDELSKSWIMPILKLADEQKCRLIMFDCDADKIDGLETWNW